MTFREILSTMLRRWYIPLAVLAAAALATVLLARDGGSHPLLAVEHSLQLRPLVGGEGAVELRPESNFLGA